MVVSRSGGTDTYAYLLSQVVSVIEKARLGAVRSVNSFLTSAYWLVGQRIIEHEQQGARRAEYGEELLKNLSRDLQQQLGRGFSKRNLELMRSFYLSWPNPQTVSTQSDPTSIAQTLSAQFKNWPAFSLPWSHYVRLLSVSDEVARQFY